MRLCLLLCLVLSGCVRARPSVPDAPEVFHMPVTRVILGQSFRMEIASWVPANYAITGDVPPGMKITREHGALWMKGTFLRPGDFTFRIQ